MEILVYNELDTKKIIGFDKLYHYLLQDDFKSAQVKKIAENLYRAKLNKSDRILFSIYQYQQKKYILLLEYLKRHDYQGSRFLNHLTVINEDQIPVIESIDVIQVDEHLVYINPKNPQFVILNKCISFDETQQAIYQHALPIIMIGSAGSGKTAILLEKMKKLEGHILYVTLSSFLVKNSHDLYYSHQYQNEQQIIDFYSFSEFIESIQIPSQQPIRFEIFYAWYIKYYKSSALNAHALYEEFKGVITGISDDQPYLSEQEYLNLGIKQSIFDREKRTQVYQIFEHYLRFLDNENYYDHNILSFQYLSKIQNKYDVVVIDEVQDITPIQLRLILKSLIRQGQFLLCGDSNQIVHPNFFSWAKIKSLFYQYDELHQGLDIASILHHNYRNSQRVTEIANRILLLKNARFGSIDKESHYLVNSNAEIAGGVYFLKDRSEILTELDQKTSISTQFAVVVMHDEQKKAAQRFFKTPLVFSIQEAKGLEYQNIILYNFVSSEFKNFNAICQDIATEDLQKDFIYARNKNKADRSLEIYKFYINALYVGLTRAVANLYWIENADQHKIFNLLGLQGAAEYLNLAEQKSSLQDWQREAQKLELQGKKEQAQRIRKEILKEEMPSWQILSGQNLQQLQQRALVQEKEDKKAKLMLFEYAIIYQNQRYLFELSEKGFKPAIAVMDRKNGLHHYLKAIHGIEQKYYLPYMVKNPTGLLQKIEKFGINFVNEFNHTPLMASVWTGNLDLFKKLLIDGADQQVLDNQNKNILQVALTRAVDAEKYCKNFFTEFYHQINWESLILQIDQKLFKIESNQAEYLIFHTMFAVFMAKIHQLWVVREQAFDTAIFIELFKYFPENIMPELRKKRSYLSAILSKNECYGQDSYNKKLFLRIKRGHYIFNPDLSIKINETWYKIYDVLDIEAMNYFTKEQQYDFYPEGLADRINLNLQNRIDHLLQHAGKV